MPEIICVSPVDGREVARRNTASGTKIDEALRHAREAQRRWAAVPLEERIAAVMSGVEALGAMNEDIVSELALQMGRPVRYGGEFRGV
ncbi:MAG: aldehyde dehydrogenase family protein, partial [Hyphomicrobiales bacterium]|nr:aldehyde dehydrogenase family protein [Hyphomicrobiales bacterium]